MSFRAYRRIRIAPGFTLNLSKRGTSLSAGRRGAHVTFGTRGTRVTAGIPGTGLSYTRAHRWRRITGRISLPTQGPRPRQTHIVIVLVGLLFLTGETIRHPDVVFPIFAGVAVFCAAIFIFFYRAQKPDLSHVTAWADQVHKFFPEDADRLHQLVLQNRPLSEIEQQMKLTLQRVKEAQTHLEIIAPKPDYSNEPVPWEARRNHSG